MWLSPAGSGRRIEICREVGSKQQWDGKDEGKRKRDLLVSKHSDDGIRVRLLSPISGDVNMCLCFSKKARKTERLNRSEVGMKCG